MIDGAPEQLVSELVECGAAGLGVQRARATLGDGLEAACHELARRGFALEVTPERLRLPDAARHFSPAVFATQRSGTFGASLEAWGCTASTNDLARQSSSAAHGAVWVCEQQTAGRGRQGRSWQVPRHSALLVSLRLECDLRQAPRPTLLPVALALGACEGLRHTTGLDVRWKWPNDLVLERRKLAGMLVEATGARAVVGLGVNVTAEPDDLAAFDLLQATSLAIAASAPEREPLLASILLGMERRFDDWRHAAWEALLPACMGLDALAGQRIRVQAPACVYEGTARGVTPQGLLQLEQADGTLHCFAAAEVHLL